MGRQSADGLNRTLSTRPVVWCQDGEKSVRELMVLNPEGEGGEMEPDGEQLTKQQRREAIARLERR